MSELTKDLIKFTAEVILILTIFSVIFDPERGIAVNTFNYLTYAEPITLQNQISTAMTVAGYSPGEFFTSFTTSGMPYKIDIYKEGKTNYIRIDLSLVSQVLINTKLANVNPLPILTDCEVEDQIIILKKELIQTIRIKKIIENNNCKVFIETI